MDVVTRGKRLNGAEARALTPSCEYDVAIEPCAAWRHLGEGHANVERDAAFFGKDLHGSDVPDGRDHGVEERANLRWLPGEVMLQIVAPARVPLVAVRELAAALLAAPQRRTAQIMAPAEAMPDDTPSGAAAPRSRRQPARAAR